MKKRSGRNLIRFFYHLLVVLVMAMPMLSGLVRIIYVQANQNAKDSYYGETINESETLYTDYTNLIGGNIYTFNFVSFTSSLSINGRLYVSNVYVGTTLYSNVVNISMYHSPTTDFMEIYLNDATSTLRTISNIDINNVSFTYNYDTFNGGWLTGRDIFSYIHYLDFSYLDNSFDYSLWKTMQDFTFHSDFRFTDIANGMLMTFDNNNLYIQYINFYINWVLTCAVISFAPYVLLSFYHLAIGLLDKFMKKGDDL